MTLERFLSVAAYLSLLGFLLVLFIYVPSVDLTLVLLTTALLCGYDLFFHRVPPHDD